MKRIESDVDGSNRPGDSVRVLQFEILSDAVPDVDALKERAVAIVEHPAVVSKLIREL